MDDITHILENVGRCKYFEAGVHIKHPNKNSYQDGLGRTIQTLDHIEGEIVTDALPNVILLMTMVSGALPNVLMSANH